MWNPLEQTVPLWNYGIKTLAGRGTLWGFPPFGGPALPLCHRSSSYLQGMEQQGRRKQCQPDRLWVVPAFTPLTSVGVGNNRKLVFKWSSLHVDIHTSVQSLMHTHLEVKAGMSWAGAHVYRPRFLDNLSSQFAVNIRSWCWGVRRWLAVLP